ncbi:MAG: Fic family protein [Phycisphaerales bacterium]
MRIPEQAPILEEVITGRVEEVLRARSDSRYSNLIEDANRAHRHWQKIKYIARANKLDPLIVWANVKLGRTGLAKRTPFRGANGAPIHYMVPDQVARELMFLDQEAAGRMASDADVRLPAGVSRERFIIRGLMEEAIASSMLEGAVTTRHDAKQMIRSGRKPRTVGERMVLNNYKTMQFIREHADTPLSPDFLLELQRMLTVDTLEKPDQSGRIRTDADPVRVEDHEGNTIYTPPPASELSNRLTALCRFANHPEEDQHFIHPIIRATLLHFQIAIDHPFCDGNGRTARAVFYWYAIRNKYWLAEFMPISTLIRKSSTQYALAYLYAETDSYDATYFLMYNARIFGRARDEMNAYIRRKAAEQSRAAGILKADEGLNLRQREVLLKHSRDDDRQTTIHSHALDYQISYQTARTDLLQLVNRGYLSSFKDGKTYVFMKGRRLTEVEAPD